jgi:signal transduction histidine kinase/transcriptional regulator with GAF, ATPase, and Fis domain
MLALALFHLSFGLLRVSPAALVTLLGGYALITLFSALELLAPLRAFLARRGLATRRATGPEPIVVSFLVDSALVVGVTLLGTDPDSTRILLLLLLAGVRVFAVVPRLRSGLIALPFTLPLALLLTRGLPVTDQPRALLTLGIETLLISCLLIIAYALLRNLNAGLGQAVQLRAVVAQRDQQIAQVESTVLAESRRRAEQVERLQALQDGIHAVNSAMELPDLLHMVVTNAVRVMKGEQASIGLLDDATGELVIQAATGVEAGALRRRRFAPGVGIAGWVLQHGQPLNIPDVEQDDRYIDPPARGFGGHATRSMLCVPLLVERHVIGTLSVTHSQPHALTRDDEALLVSFAGQAALAVHKTRLLAERTRQGDELRRRGELIASLMTIRHAVLSSLDLPEVLHTTITRIGELVAFDQGRIYLLDPHTGEAAVAARVPVGPGAHGAAPAGDALALRPGSPLWPLWEQARATGTPLQDSGDHGAHLILPLINRGRALGCMILVRHAAAPHDPQAAFDDAERDIAEQLAGTATIAIDNARLFLSLAQQQQQTAALYRLMLKVSDAPNRRQLAHVICQEIGAITGATAAALLIHDAEQGRFSGWAASGAWEGRREVLLTSLPAHGDPFVGAILTQLQGRAPGATLILPNVPPQASENFATRGCITIPLTLAGRIYGLLILQPAPGASQPIPDEVKETVSLAISHSTVALERTELFEQTLAAARQSSMLHSIASEVQGSLDPATVLHTAAKGALMALPVYSCEVYVFEDERKILRRRGVAVSRGAEDTRWRPGPDAIILPENPTALEVLYSPGLVAGDLDGPPLTEDAGSRDSPAVVVGRLLGSEEVLGLVRLTTWLPAEEFVRHHGTFCQTLWVHSGGALERSRLYTTAASQAHMLRQRAQQLTDILHLGSISAADVPLTTLLPRMAAGIARSLGFTAVQIGEVEPDVPTGVAQPAAWDVPSGPADGVRPLAPAALHRLLAAGRSIAPTFKGVTLDLTALTRLLPAGAAPLGGAAGPRPDGSEQPVILMPLESTGGGTLGYLIAAPPPEEARPGASAPLDQERLEVLSIFAQQTALMLENHQIYSQLLTSSRKLEGVVLSISDGVIVTDAELHIMITNSLADQLLGVEPGAAYGTPIGRFLDDGNLIRQLEECLATGQATPIDVDLPLGREARTYQAVVHPIAGAPAGPDAAGDPPGTLGVVITLRDVTLERATERAKSDFLSIVSHELRTPLNSIMGFMDIILMGKTGPLNELQTDFLSTAKQESVALQRLIDDVLDYSQIQSRMLRVVRVPIDLSGVIARVANQAVPRMAEDELRLVNTVPPQILVMGDEVRLAQVFKNLLDNAAKFTDPGGEIRFSAQVDDETVLISVQDNGCGIPPAQVGGVFDRFFQAENSSTRRKRGLGLGLAICKSIIDAHEGRIWIESEQGVGTTVFVELRLFRPDRDLANFDLDSGRAMIKAWG